MKPLTRILIVVGILLAVIVVCLEWQPHGGWLIDRLVAQIIATVLAFICYYGGEFKAGVSNAKDQYNTSKSSVKTHKPFVWQNASFWLWFAAWTIGFQIMVSLYIADR